MPDPQNQGDGLGVDAASGRPIVGFRLDITGAGGGLGNYLEIDPVRLRQGDVVKVLIEAVCVDVSHPVEDSKEPDEGGVYESAKLKARTAIIVEGEVYDTAITTFVQRAELEQEKRAGVQRLDLLGADHAAGRHRDGLVDGCPECDREADLERQEAGAE